MNFKKIISLTLAFLMFTSLAAAAKTLEFTMGANTMYESDEVVKAYELENAPYTQNGRTMVPVRIISERFGAEVGWDGEKNQVTIVKDDKTIILTLGTQEALVNGETVVLDAIAEEFNGRTMVPLRFISETLGMNVGYVASTQQVLIGENDTLIKINDKLITVDDYKAIMVFLGFKEGDAPLEYVKAATDFFQKIYSSVAYIKSMGVDNALYNYETEVSEGLLPYSEEIYSSNALIAPIADLLENDIFIADFINTYLESDAGSAVVEQKYISDYVTAKHILITFEDKTPSDAKKEAQSILKQLQGGADFDKLMLEHCEDPGIEQYPNGYTFTKGEMVEEFEAAAFALEEGEISDIIETSYGYHIIKREPLAQIDYNIYYAIANAAANELYDQLFDGGVRVSDIQINMTNEEIAKLFE